MAGILDGVNQRTQLVGKNRMELLLFRLSKPQRYGINVFKVREVIECPVLRRIPHSNPAVRGVSHVRGQTITVIDLGAAIGDPLPDDTRGLYVVITEFNRFVQGFLVSSVERIVNMNWEAIRPPPLGCEQAGYLTAVTQIDDQFVQIIDVERVLSEVTHAAAVPVLEAGDAGGDLNGKEVMVVDDSSVARNQIVRTLEPLGISCIVAKNGREALVQLQKWADSNDPILARLGMVISDIEMPEMDGYTLTAEIRRDPRLQNLYVLLHSSLSGVFNDSMVKKVGADQFLAKFIPEELVRKVLGTVDPARRLPPPPAH